MRKGERCPYRPQPHDFVEVYVREGFNGACAHYQAHKRNVQQWVDANGGWELVDRRLRHLSSMGRRATVNRVLAQRVRRVRMMQMVAE